MTFIKSRLLQIGAFFLLSTFLIVGLFIQSVFAANTHSIDLEESSSQYLSISDASQTGLDITGDISVEAWVKLEQLPSSASHHMGLINKWKVADDDLAFELQAASGDDLIFRYTSDGVGNSQSDAKVTDFFDANDVGEWVHVAATADVSQGATGTQIYKNGVAQTMNVGQSGATSIINTGAPFEIGRDLNDSQTLDGLIDEVRVWNDVRTAQEIADNYQQELNGSEANLQGYWKLNNGLLDETSNSNDLTNNGSAVFSTDTPFSPPSFDPVFKVRKSSDESVTSTTTLQVDNELVLTLASSTTYIIDGVLFAESSSNVPDLKIAFDIPTGATMDVGYIAASGNAVQGAEQLETDDAAGSKISLTANTPVVIQLTGTIIIGSTEGDVTLKWAQDAVNANATILKAGSYLRAEEL